MAPLIIAVLAVALVVAVVWPHRHRIPRPQRGRRVECCACGDELPIRRAVVVVDVADDDEAAMFGGGSAMVAEYHRRCAPKAA